MIYQIAYFSAASPVLTDKDVHGILRSSNRNNRQNDVSGMLLLVDKSFFQVLEGPKDKVEETFARIAVDTRHSGVIRVIGEEREERGFPGWSMGFEKILYGDPTGDVLPVDIRELASNPVMPGLRQKSPEIVSFMRSLYAGRDMKGAPLLDRPA